MSQRLLLVVVSVCVLTLSVPHHAVAQAMAGIAGGSLDVDFDIEELSIALPEFGLRAFAFEVDQTVFGVVRGSLRPQDQRPVDVENRPA